MSSRPFAPARRYFIKEQANCGSGEAACSRLDLLSWRIVLYDTRSFAVEIYVFWRQVVYIIYPPVTVQKISVNGITKM